MDFPAFVPHAVRQFIADRLEGEDSYGEALASASARVARAEESRTADSSELAELRALRDALAFECAILQRLASDARMQPAYATLLAVPDVSDDLLTGFVHAAWAARMDYAAERRRISQAADQAAAVAVAAERLARLLNEAQANGIGGLLPAEFFSVPALMEAAEHRSDDRDFAMWPAMRRVILGRHRPIAPVADDDAHGPVAVSHVFVAPGEATGIDPAEEARNVLRYAWCTAPSVARFVRALGAAARDHVPQPRAPFVAALASRKRNDRYEYLRAFITLLRDEHRIEPRGPIIAAMVPAANVVLNDPDEDVSANDVRHALASLADSTP